MPPKRALTVSPRPQSSPFYLIWGNFATGLGLSNAPLLQPVVLKQAPYVEAKGFRAF
jgi:hypothetical protein